MSESEYRLARTIAAPRGEVFRAWTDPDLLSQWWGPHALINPECEIEARPGGRLRILMRDPDRTEFLLTGTVRECRPPESLDLILDVSAYPVEWHQSLIPGHADDPVDLHLAAVFADLGGSTHLSIRIHFESPALRAAYLRAGLDTGWEEGLDSLAALLRPILTSIPNQTS